MSSKPAGAGLDGGRRRPVDVLGAWRAMEHRARAFTGDGPERDLIEAEIASLRSEYHDAVRAMKERASGAPAPDVKADLVDEEPAG